MPTVKIIMLIGLPGSGKTTYANEYIKIHGHNTVRVIDFDKFIRNKKSYDNDISTFMWCSINDGNFVREVQWNPNQTIICDGLFDTQHIRGEVITKLIEYINSIFVQYKVKTSIRYTVEFVVWENNIEACIANDARRIKMYGKDRSAKLSIEHIQMETPVCNKSLISSDTIDLSTIYFNDIVKKEVFTVSGIKAEIYDYASYNEINILKSCDWVTDGAIGNYMLDSLTPIEGSSPLAFVEFDNLLENLCPSITFLQYRRVRAKCVTIKENREHDYYGGYVDRSHWECDLEKLYNALLEENVIED